MTLARQNQMVLDMKSRESKLRNHWRAVTTIRQTVFVRPVYRFNQKMNFLPVSDHATQSISAGWSCRSLNRQQVTAAGESRDIRSWRPIYAGYSRASTARVISLTSSHEVREKFIRQTTQPSEISQIHIQMPSISSKHGVPARTTWWW